MENKGLLFIPDISGFTRFVNETELDHSRLIIEELLEILINANEIGLEVSEIEGDAILFYKFGDAPSMEALYKQVEKMFCEFHQHLVIYDLRKFCQCKACLAAVDLSLKVITHYGEFTGYNVRNFNKLIGKDIIVAHQLLKNDIEQHEYWLVTKSLQDNPPMDFKQWMKWDSSAKKTDNGDVPFHYTQLAQLKKELPSVSPLQLELLKKEKVISVSREYDADIIALFHATGDFHYRHRWQEGIKSVEEVSHFLPRVGMRNRITQDNGQVVIYASSYSFHPDKIEFSETDEAKKSSTGYTLIKTDNNKVKLTIDYFLEKNFFNVALFNLTKKKKMEAAFQRSLTNLADVVKEIKLPEPA